MKKDHRKIIKEMLGEMKCPKNFRCMENGGNQVCRTRDLGIEKYLECLEKNPGDCKFSIRFGHSYLCKCPLRVYIAKNLPRSKLDD